MDTSIKLSAILNGGTIPMLIGDRMHINPAAKRIDLLSPSSGELLGMIQNADSQDVEEAVKAARVPFDTGVWPGSPRSRAQLMLKFSQLVERDAEILKDLDSLCVGLTIRRSRDEIYAVVEDFEYFAGWCSKIEGSVVPVSDSSIMAVTVPEPVGVCAAITSWNWPMEGFSAKIAPAIAAGNTVIVKPSEQATPSIFWLARLALEAGFPPGVINVISGNGSDAGAKLIGHPRVDAVSFTGSTAVGEIISSHAREKGKKLNLLLSGTCYSIVFEDSDVEAAAKRLVSAAFDHSGQNCISPSRVFVQKSQMGPFVEAIQVAASEFIVGDPFAENTNAGPLISAKAYSRVSALLESAIGAGAQVIAQGRIDPSASKAGAYLRPHVLTNVPKDHPLALNEVFGPILSIIGFDSEEEVINLTRNYTSTLAVGIWTKNLQRAKKLANSIRAGTVWVNGYGIYDSAMSTGGWGYGGLGRELGKEALEFYLRRKSIWFAGGE